MEAFSIEIIIKNSKNILTNTQSKHPSSKGKIFEEYLKNFFNKAKITSKPTCFVGDLNLLDYNVKQR